MSAPAPLAPLIQPPLSAHQAGGLDLILEGFLLHHGRSRGEPSGDPGHRVLSGDYCYADGLVRVAEAGDLFVIEALSDLIALGAGLVARGRRRDLPPLWRATLVAIAGHGGEAVRHRHVAARDALRQRDDAGPLARLAEHLAPTPGLAEALGT